MYTILAVLFIAGNLKKALDLTIELLSILPNHERALGNLAYYEAAIKNGTTELGKSEQPPKAVTAMLDPEERERYHMLCRNENLMSIQISSQLRCRYTNNNRNPLLLIAPLKEEEAYFSPRIILYRDVLYDNEIEVIKRMAQPRVSLLYFKLKIKSINLNLNYSLRELLFKIIKLVNWNLLIIE